MNDKEEQTLRLPPGIKLVASLVGGKRHCHRLVWSPTGELIAAAYDSGRVCVWRAPEPTAIATFDQPEPLYSLAFSSDGSRLLYAGALGMIYQVDLATRGHVPPIRGHSKATWGLASIPNGPGFASSSDDGTVKLWSFGEQEWTARTVISTYGTEFWHVAISKDSQTAAACGTDLVIRVFDIERSKLKYELTNHSKPVLTLAFSPSSSFLAAACSDGTIPIWNLENGRLVAVLEGHVGPVDGVSFSSDGALLASKSFDGAVRIWRVDRFETVATIHESQAGLWVAAVAFHPHSPFLATLDTFNENIRLWEVDSQALLLNKPTIRTTHYVNAKVVLLGDSGVGKSGLSLVLTGKKFEATESTPGRRVETFGPQEVHLTGDRRQTRETLLWDFAGQPGYRVVQQLYLNEVAVALVVFDARSETDPLGGMRHWERALRVAQQRQGSQSVRMKKFLVSARSDRGGVSVSKQRLDDLLNEFGFDGYFETSAKEGWGISELRIAIARSIPWDQLPVVTSSDLFASIKGFLLKVKGTGRLLVGAADILDEFTTAHLPALGGDADVRAQFDMCVGRLENRDLVRRLSFGGYVLLQPELLDAYASAMVNAAKNEPDGLGSIAEDAALAGRFYVPDEQKIADRGLEQLLLYATVEELVRHDLALRDIADDGRHLIFPSQFNRDYEDAPEPKGKAVSLTFDGPVQSLYSTLAVRLSHSGLFETGRGEMWRNAAVFTARVGGKCGIYLNEFAEGRGRLLIFFDGQTSDQTRFHFEEYIFAHVDRRAVGGTVEVVRFFVCTSCGTPVPDAYVRMLTQRNLRVFVCPCGGMVSLVQPNERLEFKSQLDVMNKSADRHREYDTSLTSAAGEVRTPAFLEWAGGDRVTLAIVFTDVVGSTNLGNQVGDERMDEVRAAHFDRGRRLIANYGGREIKTIGDAFMMAFRSVDKALDVALALQTNTGHPQVQIRAGIHVGALGVGGSDVFGGTVNFAARVVGAIQGAEIWLSDRAKQDIDSLLAKRFSALRWKEHTVQMKGFSGSFTLWSLVK